MGAFAIRLALARGDLWGDEAASVTLSLQPLRDILTTLARSEPHPPLYPIFLQFWMRLVGTDELLVRLPSIFAGTALAAASVGLGKLVSERVGVVAGLLTAISPFLIWYSTESRMYPFAALGAALSVLSFHRLTRNPRRSTIALFATSIAFALLSHYFTLFVATALGFISLKVMYAERLLIRPIIAAWLIGLVPFALWAVLASRIVGTYYGAAAGSIDISSIGGRAIVRMGSGWSIDAPTATTIGMVIGFLVFVSIILHRSVRIVRWSVLWLASVFLIPAAISLARPMYQERYLIVAAPAYLLLIAVLIGMVNRKLIRSFLLLAVVGSALPAISNMANGNYIKSQYGTHTREVNALGTTNEAVVLTGPSQAPLYSYYASRGGIGLPVFALPRAAPAPEPATSDELRQISQRFSGLWLFLYAVNDYDPAQIIEQWLNANAYRAPPRWTVNGRLVRYVTEQAADLGPISSGEILAPGQSIAAALPRGTVLAGSLVPVLLHISIHDQQERTPKLRLRLIDDRGFLWGEADEPLGTGFIPPDRLFATGTRVERRAIGITAGAPNAPLRLEGHIYQESPGGPKVIGTVILGKVNVQSSNRFWSDQIVDFVPGNDRTSNIDLIGSSVAPTRRTGERAYITTIWRSPVSVSDFDQILRIMSPAGKIISTQRQTVSSQEFPLLADHVLRIQSAPAIGANWAPGDYQVQIGLASPGNTTPESWASQDEWKSIGRIRVTQGTPIQKLAEPEVSGSARFGDTIELVGYSVGQDPLTVTLRWHAVGAIDRPWTIFLHIVDRSDKIVAQADGQPGMGNSPTDGWSIGDLIDDRHTLNFGIPGEYRLIVGLYDAVSGERMIASSRNGERIGDSLQLGSINVVR